MHTPPVGSASETETQRGGEGERYREGRRVSETQSVGSRVGASPVGASERETAQHGSRGRNGTRERRARARERRTYGPQCRCDGEAEKIAGGGGGGGGGGGTA